MSWLVTGGAGYIGAHVVAAMCAKGEDVVVVDDLSTGCRERLDGVPLVVGSTLDAALLQRTMRDHRVSGVVHLAAKKQVEESVHRPLYYYEQNVEGLRVLLSAMTAAAVGSFVFSSSAAVYGAAEADQVSERSDTRPVNAYGETKLVGERMTVHTAQATGLRYASLRYFNVAGCGDPLLADRGASNLVPMVFQRITDEQAPMIFGDDYATPDGTCVRDFVHVEDIASAHVTAAQRLETGDLTALTANIGRGEGVSVRELIDTVRHVTGTTDESWAEPTVRARRPGDPPRVVAAVDVIRAALGWRAQHDVVDMVTSAWAGWEESRARDTRPAPPR